MADFLKKSASWLGFVTDDRYAYEDEVEEYTEEEAEPAQQRRTRPAPQKVSALPAPEPQRYDPVVDDEPSVADLSRIITVHPRTYNEARTIGEHFREGVPVIMNLSDMEDADAKRLVDFAAGLIFGLHGTIERVTSKVFLLSPHNVSVAQEDKQRIAGSFFNQS